MLLTPILNPAVLLHGDKVWTHGRTLGVERHYGIWDAEYRMLLHNTVPGGVQYIALEAFRNRGVFVEERASAGFEHAVVAQARALLGKPYDLLTFNCEHYANLVHGKKESPQIQRAVGGLLAVAGIWGLFVRANSPVYSSASGRYHDKRTGRFVSK